MLQKYICIYCYKMAENCKLRKAKSNTVKIWINKHFCCEETDYDLLKEQLYLYISSNSTGDKAFKPSMWITNHAKYLIHK